MGWEWRRRKQAEKTIQEGRGRKEETKIEDGKEQKQGRKAGIRAPLQERRREWRTKQMN